MTGGVGAPAGGRLLAQRWGPLGRMPMTDWRVAKTTNEKNEEVANPELMTA